MINLFGKNKSLKSSDLHFLYSIVSKLPEKYSYLKPQISDDFLLGKFPNEFGDKWTFTLTLNAKLENKYSNKFLPSFFILKNIFVLDIKTQVLQNVELHIMEGMLAGYRIGANISEIDLTTIDVTNVIEKHFDNHDYKRVMEIIGKVDDGILKKLDLQNCFKIEIENEIYYTIASLRDGDYLTIDTDGAVFLMKHNPFQIQKIYNNKEDFLNELRIGGFVLPA